MMNADEFERIMGERLERETREVCNLCASIFALGFLCGVVFAYSSGLQLGAGLLTGYLFRVKFPHGDGVVGGVVVGLGALIDRGWCALRSSTERGPAS